MYKNRLLFAILMMFCSMTYAQNDSLYLNGTLTIDKNTSYKYAIAIAKKEKQWEGYSILDKGGVNETKTKLKAKFLSQHGGGFAFTETQLLYSKSAQTSFCFIDGVLKVNTKKNQLKGLFVGKDKEKKFCGKGQIVLYTKSALLSILPIENINDSTVIPAIITQKISKKINVTSDHVQLQIWDGGVFDHDSLQISIGSNIIVPQLEITKELRTIDITLQEGENIISIKALNEGTEPPNSAQFMIKSSNISKPIISYLKKGETAIIKINFQNQSLSK